MTKYTKAYIGQLLERYMDGTSTIEEESILSRYFAQEREVPAKWEPYRLLFAEIESMKPVSEPKRHWWRWCISAAAVVAFVITLAVMQEPQTESGMVAQQTGKDSLPIRHHIHILPDSVTKSEQPRQTPQSTKRCLRKPQPTMTDYDKAYALMAEAAKEQQQAEQEMEQAHYEILHTQLTAAGYVSIRQEDGTIIYTNEPKEYFAYEE